MTNQKKHPVRKALTVSALVAGAAAAGYYFYGSGDAKKHRKVVAKWAHTVKKEAIRHVEKAKKIDRASVSAAVDKATRAIKTQMPNIDTKQLQALGSELKKNWSKVANEAVKGAKKVAKKVSK